MSRFLPRLLSPNRLLVAALFLAFVSSGCKHVTEEAKEVAYVNTPQVVLRDRLAPIFEKKGTVKLGDKVYVLDRDRRFSLVRNERGEQGWIADRYLVDSATYDQFVKLGTENKTTPMQARGTTRATLNLHVSPGRDTEHLFQVKEASKVEILKRATAEKPGAVQVRPSALKTGGKEPGESSVVPVLEDWSLVRTSEGHVGWVLARMLDVDVPLEIAQYSEGQRIVSSFVLNQVEDGGKRVPQYLVMTSDNKDGLPWDFNQIRVFTWNVKRHRYETAYRERELMGVFPVKVGTDDFGQEGVLPVFTLRVKDSQGKESERKYRMIGPIVRRVATPEELKQEAADRAARRLAEKQAARKGRR